MLDVRRDHVSAACTVCLIVALDRKVVALSSARREHNLARETPQTGRNVLPRLLHRLFGCQSLRVERRRIAVQLSRAADHCFHNLRARLHRSRIVKIDRHFLPLNVRY